MVQIVQTRPLHRECVSCTGENYQELLLNGCRTSILVEERLLSMCGLSWAAVWSHAELLKHTVHVCLYVS